MRLAVLLALAVLPGIVPIVWWSDGMLVRCLATFGLVALPTVVVVFRQSERLFVREWQRAHDATDRRVEERAEEALRTLSRVIEQTDDSVFVTDRDGVIQYVNPSFERLTGYSRQEAIGATPRLFKSDAHEARFFVDLWQRLLAGSTVREVFTNRRKDGRLYYEDQTVSPVRDAAGRITQFVSTGRDITERKRTDAALRRLNNSLEHEASRIAGALHDEAGQFLTVAHITLADVARTLPPAARERLQEVRQNLEQIEDQLRRLSHELRPRILDDLGLVEALRFLAEGVSGRTGIPITVEASVNGPCPSPVATAIYRMVQEALNNITRHARATRGSVVLKQEGEKIACSVDDDGVGFDAVGHGSNGHPGLGLLGIQGRLEALGAQLTIRSAPGAGTELLTTIQLERSDAAPNSPGG
ncbi:MAG TPA: PAS domain S-box protein [Vicinamibacterales bacterium]|jgi:PAS domain S-box-containing protein